MQYTQKSIQFQKYRWIGRGKHDKKQKADKSVRTIYSKMRIMNFQCRFLVIQKNIITLF